MPPIRSRLAWPWPSEPDQTEADCGLFPVRYARFGTPAVHGSRFRKLAKQHAVQALGLLVLGTGLTTGATAQIQTWEKAPPLPTDMRNLLSTISTDSNLYRIYEQYRENRDGLQKAAERISLADALARGLTTSPELAATVAEIQASEWNGVTIQREWMPSLSFKTSNPGVLGYTTSSSSLKTKTPGSEETEVLKFEYGFRSNPYADLSWSFFDPSRTSRQSAQGSRIQALRQRLIFTTRELILAIQTAYTALQENLEREKDLIELFNQSIAIYISAHKSQRPVGEISRLEAQAVSLLIARVNAHKDSIRAMDTLASLLNLEPGKLALPSEKPGVIPIWPLTRGDSIQQALERREELRANALEIQALMSDARAIRRKMLPDLSLSGQLQRNNLSQQGGSFTDNLPGSLTRTIGYTTFVGLTFDWKVFDGGIRQAKGNAFDAKARQTQAEGEQTRLTITREVADAYAGLVASKILVDAARVDVDASRRSLQAAIRNYEARLHNDEGTTVVQAILKLQTALNTYRNLVANQNTSTYQLYRSTATWPSDTENLVKAQYQRWLAPPAASPLPAVKPSLGP